MAIYPDNFSNLGQTKNSSGKFRSGEPKYIVQHYTAGGGGAGSARFLFGAHKPASSAHFVVDRDGKVYQVSDTSMTTWHAGQSYWRGISMLNGHAIGIEYANYGYWRPGIQPSTSQAARDAGWLEAAHKNDPSRKLLWEPYPEPLVAAGLALTQWLMETHPTIRETMGHDDIAPRRKSDPGPAFPMERFQRLFSPDSTGSKIPVDVKPGVVIKPAKTPTFVVNAETLNLRGGPGTGFSVIHELKRGDQVLMLLDQGEWAVVRIWKDGKPVDGYVYDQYLSPK